MFEDMEIININSIILFRTRARPLLYLSYFFKYQAATIRYKLTILKKILIFSLNSKRQKILKIDQSIKSNPPKVFKYIDQRSTLNVTFFGSKATSRFR